MAYITATTNWIDLSWISKFVNKVVTELEHRSKVKSTVKELSRLSDRELNDIGISRGDIWAIANEDSDFKRFANTNTNLEGWV